MLRWIKRYKWWLIIGSVLMIIGLIIGGIHLEEQRQAEFKQEMIKQVKEHDQVWIDFLKSFDDNHKIKKITVDYDSVTHNPMGGIDFAGYVNDNKKLQFQANLDKMSEDGHDKYEASDDISNELDDFLSEDD
ncbi:DUF1310 family protein [Bombilactobacillus thymidiniphilus]|uniref:DUF1310 domain-containing protein n=1 Tax=Bombilactobacillus thymidiniphilus TaxID=2923363 RepID=A0ABY4PG17_9LACO|nr:DUF1310 family protein [Bombilactobacillus thymidiniphilus]UQS84267.1 DUF1310 domain-containing protein [Bombilactobacillus thymidiniphilus]